MLLNCIVMQEGLMRLNRRREEVRGQGLRDPLERSEWRGVGHWVDRLLCRLSRFR